MSRNLHLSLPIRRDIAELSDYAAVEPPEQLAERLGIGVGDLIKLDANENPYGPAPGVAQAVAQARFDLYPDPLHLRMRQAIESYAEAPVERIMFGNGSDELLELVIRLFLEPGDEVVSCPPTFGMYSFLPPLFFGKVIAVPRFEDFRVDVPAVLAALTERTKLIVLAAPNNPSGTPLPEADLRRLLESGRVVVLDEAYVEFAGSTAIPLTGEYGNLIVLRTFSKWAGLAGLRVGWGVFPADIMPHLWKIKQPYNVNVAAQAAVLASLRQRDLLLANVGRIVAERERLRAALSALPGWSVLPSAANFLLCQVPSAVRTFDHLLRHGIAVRRYSAPRLERSLRISVGQPEESDRLLEVLRSTEA
ncbi:MAG: histidinol-phosphate transaminase [Chloroflexota bacterium]